jgi:hypothetical protein
MKVCDRCKDPVNPIAREYKSLNDGAEIHLCALCAVEVVEFAHGVTAAPKEAPKTMSKKTK